MRARTTTTTVALIALLLTAAAPAAAEDDHRVEPGETLSEIAAAHRTTVRAMAEANALADADRIVVGQVLVIPGSGSAPAAVVHVVAPGETLSGIARRYGTTPTALGSANGIRNPDLVRIGQRLTIPAGSGSGSTGGTGATAAPAPVRHTVVGGETLAGIARRYGTTVGAVVAANSLSNPNLVRIGQQLTIPAGNAASGAIGGSTSGYARTGDGDGHTGVAGTHTVVSGDTLSSIARRYGITTADLAAANGLFPAQSLYTSARLRLDAPNRLPNDIARCPVPAGTYVNDWGFPRSGGRAHEGNDLFAARGTPVAAPVAGIVSYATGSIGGKQFRLRGDDGTTYLGSHLDAFGVTGRVRAGDTIGYVGDTGNARGSRPHLHFEVHPDGGAAMNPYPVLRQACG